MARESGDEEVTEQRPQNLALVGVERPCAQFDGLVGVRHRLEIVDGVKARERVQIQGVEDPWQDLLKHRLVGREAVLCCGELLLLGGGVGGVAKALVDLQQNGLGQRQGAHVVRPWGWDGAAILARHAYFGTEKCRTPPTGSPKFAARRRLPTVSRAPKMAAADPTVRSKGSRLTKELENSPGEAVTHISL